MEIIPSPYPQDPQFVQTIDEVDYIVNKNGKPLFYIDGSSLRIEGSQQCIHVSTRTGYRCARFAMGHSKWGYCQAHNTDHSIMGKPTMTTRMSKKLPPRLTESYLEAMSDPEMLSLNSEIALIDVRMGELMSLLPQSKNDSLSAAQTIASAVGMIRRGTATDNKEVLNRGINLILTDAGDQLLKERNAWSEIIELGQKRARLTAKEIERRKAIRAYVTAEQAMMLVRYLISLITKYVKDSTIRNQISADLRIYLIQDTSTLPELEDVI